jgi:hypothetical protein
MDELIMQISEPTIEQHVSKMIDDVSLHLVGANEEVVVVALKSLRAELPGFLEKHNVLEHGADAVERIVADIIAIRENITLNCGPISQTVH